MPFQKRVLRQVAGKQQRQRGSHAERRGGAKEQRPAGDGSGAGGAMCLAKPVQAFCQRPLCARRPDAGGLWVAQLPECDGWHCQVSECHS